ncbi:MAG: DUF4340 domain-containing protein [Oscillospiraceae bacterium]|nr:DUF4340 domain-containing protein [Oscillospiraceae bacterium]
MNKTLKGIIGGSVLLCALGGAMAYLLLTQPEEESDSSSDSGVETLLWHVQSDKINEISVENPNGDSYTAFRKMEQTKSTDLEGNEVVEDIANYYLKGYEKLPMDTVQIRLLATRSPEVASVDTVEENASAESLKKYGLDNPVKVTYKVDDADDVSFRIGDITPLGDNRYLSMEGSNTVYLVSKISLEPFMSGINDYLGKTLKEEQAEDDDTVIESVRIERSDLDYDFYFEYDPYYKENTNGGAMAVHVMKEPVIALLSADKSAGATHGLYGLTAKEVVTPFPKQADINAAGLDKPFVTVTMKTSDKKTTVFKLGDSYKDKDGYKRYYGMMDGLDCIYSFDAELLAYDDLTPEAIISRNVIDMYVWDIGKLTCEADDLKLEFTGKGSSQDDFVGKYNGEDMDDAGIERYRKFYSYLLETRAEEIVYPEERAEEEDKPFAKLAEVHIDRQDGKRSYDIAYYDAGGLKAYIAVNGEIRFRCRKSYVDTLIENMKIFDDADKEFSMTW